MQKTTPKKGDIFILENSDSEGHEQSGNRPHVVVTQVVAGVATVAPCTTSRNAKKYQYSVLVNADKENGLDQNSYVLIFQSFACDTESLKRKIGHLDENSINKIKIEYIRYISE
jgi:mRNA interferase MazF